MYPNLPDVIHKALLADRRPPTGLLHCSSASWQPLRFTQLGAIIPEDETDFGSLITMKLGTLTHEWFEKYVTETASNAFGDDWDLIDTEIDLTTSLPEGWTGTADYLLLHAPSGMYAVTDLKTSKPEALAYLNGEPKESHWIQVSCYHAALSAEYVLDPDISICYLPKGKTARQETVLPVMVSKTAMPKQQIFSRLEEIKMRTDQYVAEYERTNDPLNKYLAPMPEGELKVSWNKAQNVFDVVLRPHWTETFIGSRFGEELCPVTSSAKMGSWTTDGFWQPRKGFSTDQEIPRPSKEQMESHR